MSTKTRPRCRACGSEDVIWAQAVNGKSVMLDKQRDPTRTSRHAVMRDLDLTLLVRILPIGEQPRPGIEHLHQPHHATCQASRKGPADD